MIMQFGWNKNGEFHCPCGTIFGKNLLGEKPFGLVWEHYQNCDQGKPENLELLHTTTDKQKPSTETLLRNLDNFTQQYLETALWAETDNADESGGNPLDDNFGLEDIDPDSLHQQIDDCREFQQANGNLFSDDPSRAGHDFWLTRNRHGAGFWDGDWPKDIGQKLTQASHNWGGVDVYVGDNGKLYFS
jgi:hypothetical protein